MLSYVECSQRFSCQHSVRVILSSFFFFFFFVFLCLEMQAFADSLIDHTLRANGLLPPPLRGDSNVNLPITFPLWSAPQRPFFPLFFVRMLDNAGV